MQICWDKFKFGFLYQKESGNVFQKLRIFWQRKKVLFFNVFFFFCREKRLRIVVFLLISSVQLRLFYSFDRYLRKLKRSFEIEMITQNIVNELGWRLSYGVGLFGSCHSLNFKLIRQRGSNYTFPLVMELQESSQFAFTNYREVIIK